MKRGLACLLGAVVIGFTPAVVLAADPADEQAIQQNATAVEAANVGTGADDVENDILISQAGSGHFALGETMGASHSSISIEQVGTNNAASVIQANGAGNSATLSQQGDDNFAIVNQSGDGNSALVSQTGSQNRLSLAQDAGGNSATISELGSASLVLNQTGGQQANITVQGTALGTITQVSPVLNMTVTGP